MDAPEHDQIPSRGYAKLDAGIIYSTLWMESHDVVRSWISLLAMSDARGFVRSSLPALAHINLVSASRMREILEIFKGPDPDSRIKAHDGRKIKEVEGGWVVLNYEKYRAICQRKPGSHADRQARYRDFKKSRVTNAASASASASARTGENLSEEKQNDLITDPETGEQFNKRTGEYIF